MLSFKDALPFKQRTLLKLVAFLLIPRYNSYVRSVWVGFWRHTRG